MRAARAGPPATLRLFFALWPTPEEQQALLAASAACVAASGGRPIPAENLHATLAFLGNVEPARLPVLRALAQDLAAAGDAGTPQLQFQRLEHWVRPQILCATAGATAGAARAGELAAAIRLAAGAVGFSPDLKPFHAHVTVARKVARAAQAQRLAEVTWNCRRFALVASTAGAAGSLYSVLDSYPLDRGENARE
ncbi:MAG TPA: RNA 2',3'-cyclic phosphodiesterase [Steroidobacteraceae bacterium]